MSTPTGIPYWQRIGLDTPPRVEDVAARDGVKLFHLLVVALIEHGTPMADAELADRLMVAGVWAPSGDLELSLRRAWHGQAPVLRVPDGRLGLDLGSSALQRVLLVTRLRAPAFRYPEAPPPPQLPGDEIPLSQRELDAAFRDRSLFGVSATRQAAAVLDAHGRALTVAEVEGVLAGLTRLRAHLTPETIRAWHGDLVLVDAEGRLVLNPGSSGLAAMRRTVREPALRVLTERALSEQRRVIWAARDAVMEMEDRRAGAQAAEIRRAVVHAVPERGTPVATTVLDIGAHTLRTLVGLQLGELPRLLDAFDVLAGLRVRELLAHFHLDPDRWRIVDLAPPRKTRKLNQRGRKLTITPELLISSSTRICRPLANPARIAEYVALGDTGRLTRRIESDTKALHAFYRFGVLHGCVRLRWGFLDEELSVDWAEPGDPRLLDVLSQAQREGAEVEVVVGTAPGWADPWSQAQRAQVIEVSFGFATLAVFGEYYRVDLLEIQEARVPAATRSDARPESAL